MRLKTEEILADLREKAGETVSAAAVAMDISPSTLSDAENGKREVRSGTIIKICQHYNVSADYLLGLSGVRSVNQTTHGIHRATGLSEKAIENLRSLKRSEASLAFVNTLLEDAGALYQFSCLIDEMMVLTRTNDSESDYKKRMQEILCVDIIRELVSRMAEKEG